jgi:cystathionine beta-synthase
MPVLDKGKLAGILTETDLLHHLVSGRVDQNTIVAELMERKVSTVGMHATSSELPRIFERGECALVVDDQRRVIALLTKMDLIEMLAARKNAMPLRSDDRSG